MQFWSKRSLPVLLIIALAFTVAACAPTSNDVVAPQAESPATTITEEDEAPAFVMPQRIAPNTYVNDYMQSEHILIDVREAHEFNSGHIEGAVNIPVGQIANRLSEIPQDTQVILYCRSGNRSNQAASILATAGYSGVLDLGGIIAWQQAGYPLQ